MILWPHGHPKRKMDAVRRNALPEPGLDVQAQRLQAVTAEADRRASAPPISLAAKKGNGLNVQLAPADWDPAGFLLMADRGTCSAAFVAGIVNQIAVVGMPARRFDETASNFPLSVARAVELKAELESTLALQMCAIHLALMALAARLKSAQIVPQQDAAERALNELARTHTMQIKALKRYRTGVSSG